jgi:K(+)-stimulated pyrophosphate-energized sodium pump
MGLVIVGLMGIAYGVSTLGLDEIMIAPSVFAFGLVAFGFLGMGPVTIAVDSYGPVADNAQSIFELSEIAESPSAPQEIQKEFGFTPDFDTVGGSMVEVQKNMARLRPQDREAIAAYLKAIPAVE